MMCYFTKDDNERHITVEPCYVVRDVNGFIIGRGGTIATAIMDSDGLSYEESCIIEKAILEARNERRF